jgi:hypothetical protein
LTWRTWPVTCPTAGEASADGFLRHEEALLAVLTEDQRQDLTTHLKTLRASLPPRRPA